MPQASRITSGSAWPANSPAKRSAPTSLRTLRDDAAGEPNHQRVGLAGKRLGEAIGAHAVASAFRRCHRPAESPACRPGRQTPRRSDRRPRRREPFEGMPQASRITSWWARITSWLACPANLAGTAIGAHAVASHSSRCHRRAEPATSKPSQRIPPASRSAPTPSRALRGDATGEPNHQLVSLDSESRRQRDRRPRRREPSEAMTQASRVASGPAWLANASATRSAPTPSRALPGDAAGEPSHQRVCLVGERPGNAIGAHAVASHPRR